MGNSSNAVTRIERAASGDRQAAHRVRGGTRGGEPGDLSVYLHQAARVPLLEPARESMVAGELACRREALKTIARKLVRGLSREAAEAVKSRPVPDRRWSLEDTERFLEEVRRSAGALRGPRMAKLLGEAQGHKRRMDEARDELILANLRLVVHVAKKYTSHSLSMLDLIQEGNLGLMKAVDRFDPRRGNRFSTYAYWWIKQSVERALSNHSRTVRLPVHVQDKLRSIRQVSEAFRTERRREPTIEEIAAELEIPDSKVREVIGHAQEVAPLEDSEHVPDHLWKEADPNAVSPFQHTVDAQRRRRVEAALRPLAPRERQVIRLRFGLGCDAHPTLESVGQEMDLSRERVRQIERRALAKMAASPDSSDLVTYLQGV